MNVTFHRATAVFPMRTPRTFTNHALLSTFVLAAIVAACGGDDEPLLATDAGTTPEPTVPEEKAPTPRDASVATDSGSSSPDGAHDAAPPSEDAADAADASEVDAATDGGLTLPPGVEECVSCALDECGPKLAACYADDVCRGLLSCAATSGCLIEDPASCVPSCIAAADLDIFETLQQALIVSQLVTSCSGCLTDCDLSL